MSKWWNVTAALLLALGGCRGAAPEGVADLVLRGGGIYTLDPGRPWAEAAAIRDGAFVAVGSDGEVARWIGPGTRLFELDGRLALPGFHDSHVHPISGGLERLQCNLNEATSVEALQERVRRCAEERSDGPDGWIVGGGWDLSLFPEGRAPRSLLDAAVGDRPAYLTGADGHSAWVSSRALALAGLDAASVDPPRGVIERDPESGEPMGTLRESAMDLVGRLVPEVDDATWERATREGLRLASSRGITSFIDASVGERELSLYHAFAQRGELTARVRASLTLNPLGPVDDGFEALLADRARYAAPGLDVDAVKIFVDGVLEGETAALLEPYLDRPDHRGTLNLEPPELASAVTRFDAMDLQVHMHAIGDRAVRAALDAVEAARRVNGPRDNRHHIAHLQLIDAADLPRFAALDVTANFQALWAYPDSYIMDVNLPVVGRARVDRMYPIGSVLRAGGRVVGGSDWSVSSIDPLEAIQMAMLRSDPDGERPGVLNAEERVDLAAMIAAYTRTGAWLMHQDSLTGSVEVGKAADVVVIDRNLFDVPADRIREARVLLTLLAGRIVYAADPAVAAGETARR